MATLKYLTSEQKQFWKENGYIKLSNVYTMKEMNEISDTYNEMFERAHRKNVSLEASWIGEDMKKAAGNIDYSVSKKYTLITTTIYILYGLIYYRKFILYLWIRITYTEYILHYIHIHVFSFIL